MARKGPTGLYGMVAPSLHGPYEPLNGTGLVIANPAAEPRQGYCWQVLDTLEVISFVDHWGLHGRDIFAEPDLQRQPIRRHDCADAENRNRGQHDRLLGLRMSEPLFGCIEAGGTKFVVGIVACAR